MHMHVVTPLPLVQTQQMHNDSLIVPPSHTYNNIIVQIPKIIYFLGTVIIYFLFKFVLFRIST